MKADQLPNGCWRKSLEEATKRRLIGEAIQTEQIEEGPVVLENFSFVDPSQSGDDSVEQSQEQVSRPIEPLTNVKPHVLLQTPSQAELLTESLNQDHAPVVCETGIAKLELPAARTSGHKRKEKRPKIAFPQILHYKVQICGTHFLRWQP
jgi:hypothetical protein